MQRRNRIEPIGEVRVQQQAFEFVRPADRALARGNEIDTGFETRTGQRGLVTDVFLLRKRLGDIEIGHYATNVSLLGMLSYKLGRSVKWNGEAERFDDDAEANELLRREYRGDWDYPA